MLKFNAKFLQCKSDIYEREKEIGIRKLMAFTYKRIFQISAKLKSEF